MKEGPGLSRMMIHGKLPKNMYVSLIEIFIVVGCQ